MTRRIELPLRRVAGPHRGVRLGYPGQYWDAEANTWHNGMRDYDPQSAGRYLQSDPIGLAGGMNTYAYASGNPVNLIDPLGLKDHSTCETDQKLASARFSTLGRPQMLGAAIMAANHGPWGNFDYKVRQPNDTFMVDGRQLSAAEFGNYIAGYSGMYYDGLRGVGTVHAAGIVIQGIEAAFGGRFNWDADSRNDINSGALRAAQEMSGSRAAGCGCNNGK